MYDKHHVDMTDNSFVHTFLSEQAQGAEKVEPGFIFPFYGHLVHNFYVKPRDRQPKQVIQI